MPEVLTVHENETNKKIYIFKRIFSSSSEKLTFEKENVIFFNTFLNFNFLNSIVIIVCKFCSYKRSENPVNFSVLKV